MNTLTRTNTLLGSAAALALSVGLMGTSLASELSGALAGRGVDAAVNEPAVPSAFMPRPVAPTPIVTRFQIEMTASNVPGLEAAAVHIIQSTQDCARKCGRNVAVIVIETFTPPALDEQQDDQQQPVSAIQSSGASGATSTTADRQTAALQALLGAIARIKADTGADVLILHHPDRDWRKFLARKTS